MSPSEQGTSLAQYSIRAVLVLTALTAAGIAAHNTFQTPLKDIDAIEVQLLPAGGN